jgi:NhaA family Na+:H+ antiporter
VFGAAVAALKLAIAERPAGASLLQLYGVAILAGIGFTMSLFISTLAFEDDSLLMEIRVDVLVASVLAGAVAALVLRLAARC